MKKSNLIIGIIYVLIGIACLLVALFTDSSLESLLCGFAGAGIVPGIIIIYKYFYWTSPKNKEKYEQKLEQEKIEIQDELKEKIRCKTAQYAYIIGLCVISISAVVFSVLDSLGIINNGILFVCYLLGYMVFQIVISKFIFNHIMKKY